MIRPFRWDRAARSLALLDQRRLPHEEVWVDCGDPAAVADAIRSMVVRGAPAIGVAAGYGVVTAFARPLPGESPEACFERAHGALEAARPTAANLRAALDRMRVRLDALGARAIADCLEPLEDEANRIAEEDLAANRRLGSLGAGLVGGGRGAARILTHCNTGSLATSGYGTALGVVRAVAASGRPVEVFAPETRPWLQGARLTAWELIADRLPVTLLTEGAVGSLVASGRLDAVIVGADRIAANGDAANKIGTYNAAVLADRHRVPFFVAAPFSTVDLETPTGAEIPIEERSGDEVTSFRGTPVAPEGVRVWNPAFDITPAKLITAIITERGVARPPYGPALSRLRSSEADPAGGR